MRKRRGLFRRPRIRLFGGDGVGRWTDGRLYDDGGGSHFRLKRRKKMKISPVARWGRNSEMKMGEGNFGEGRRGLFASRFLTMDRHDDLRRSLVQ